MPLIWQLPDDPSPEDVELAAEIAVQTAEKRNTSDENYEDTGRVGLASFMNGPKPITEMR